MTPTEEPPPGGSSPRGMGGCPAMSAFFHARRRDRAVGKAAGRNRQAPPGQGGAGATDGEAARRPAPLPQKNKPRSRRSAACFGRQTPTGGGWADVRRRPSFFMRDGGIVPLARRRGATGKPRPDRAALERLTVRPHAGQRLSPKKTSRVPKGARLVLGGKHRPAANAPTATVRCVLPVPPVRECRPAPSGWPAPVRRAFPPRCWP